MTNVDFFRAFAAYVDPYPLPERTKPFKSSPYYFEHNREALDYANIFSADEDDEEKSEYTKYIFHFTEPNGIKLRNNGSGKIESIEYSGRLLIVEPSDTQKPIDVQGGEAAEGRYELHAKPMIDGGGVMQQIADYNNLTINEYQLELLPGEEVYGILGMHGDGIWMGYRLTIINDQVIPE